MSTAALHTMEASLATTWTTLRRVHSGIGWIYLGLYLTAAAAAAAAAAAGGQSGAMTAIFAVHSVLLWLLFLHLVRRSVSVPLARLITKLDGMSLDSGAESDSAGRNARPDRGHAGHVDHLEEAVREMNRRVKYEFRALVENAATGVAILQDGRIRFANRASARLVGWEQPRDLVLLGSAVDLLPEADRTRAARLSALLQARPGAHTRLVVSFPHADGQPRWIQLHLQQVEWRGRPGLMASLSDVSRQKRLEEELRHLATYDALTGAVNRRHFLDQAAVEIDRARRHGRPLALLLLDLDHFKGINDTHGHAAGDSALKLVTKSISRHLRDIDMLARIGGEEFAVLLPDTSLEGALILAERLRHRIDTLTVQSDGARISLSASIGVADTVGGYDETVSEALRRADMALYQAKHEGRNRVVVASPTRPPFAGEAI